MHPCKLTGPSRDLDVIATGGFRFCESLTGCTNSNMLASISRIRHLVSWPSDTCMEINVGTPVTVRPGGLVVILRHERIHLSGVPHGKKGVICQTCRWSHSILNGLTAGRAACMHGGSHVLYSVCDQGPKAKKYSEYATPNSLKSKQLFATCPRCLEDMYRIYRTSNPVSCQLHMHPTENFDCATF